MRWHLKNFGGKGMSDLLWRNEEIGQLFFFLAAI